MDIKDFINRAIEVREKYALLEDKKYNKRWTENQIAQGLVGDVGDLIKLMLAKDGVRDIKDVDGKLSHEICDILWSIFVLANKLNIDLEKDFFVNMNELEKKIDKELN